VAKGRAINADVPAAPEPPPRAGEAKPDPPKTSKPKRRRRPVPAALKAIAGLVILAVVFIVAAILGGGGGGEDGAATPAPLPAAGGEGAARPTATPAEDLGFPAFATSNTTRVGGPDPASNAAGVALAAYPSTASEQQPTAVAIVDADEWQGGIAAAVLMAPPLGAPLLISEPEGLPEPASQALAALDPRGGPASGGATIFAIGEAAAPEGDGTRRIAARSAAATAAAIARLRDRLFGGAPRHIVVAPIGRPDFAMPAAAWAARSGDPVLFAGRDKLPKATAAALRRHPDVPIFVLGPSAAISSSVVRKIAAIAERVRRVSGEDPVENAIALARYGEGGFGWNINDPGHGLVLARSDSPLDAVAAAPLSASGTWGPMLLTDNADTLPAALRGYLLDVKPGYTTDPTRAFYNHVWVIGDTVKIGIGQQAEIDELAELAQIGGEP